MEEIQITAKFCHPYMNFGGDGCNEVILKYPKEEAQKLVSSVIQNNETNQGGEIDYFQYAEFWSVSFGITLSLWFFAHLIGLLLSFLKRI